MIMQKLFPGSVSGRGGSEANGLEAGTEPKNCIIIDQFHDNHYPLSERREHYLVSVEDSLVMLRICKAMPGYGYAEFAVSHGVAKTETEKNQMIDKFKGWKESFTSRIASD